VYIYFLCGHLYNYLPVSSHQLPHSQPSSSFVIISVFHIIISLCWHLQFHSHFCLNLPKTWS
jgi:hypothetical protein